jgi:hypothetical protein
VNLRPGLNQALLRLRYAPGQTFQRVDGKDSRVILVERVKVCAVVLTTRLQEHPDDDPKESREFRHPSTLHRRPVRRRANDLPLTCGTRASSTAPRARAVRLRGPVPTGAAAC